MATGSTGHFCDVAVSSSTHRSWKVVQGGERTLTVNRMGGKKSRSTVATLSEECEDHGCCCARVSERREKSPRKNKLKKKNLRRTREDYYYYYYCCSSVFMWVICFGAIIVRRRCNVDGATSTSRDNAAAVISRPTSLDGIRCTEPFTPDFLGCLENLARLRRRTDAGCSVRTFTTISRGRIA